MTRKKPENRKEATHAAQLTEKESEQLRKDIFRSDMEKLKLFTEMLRKEALFKKAVITHN
jgi:hypothetical protein